MTLGRRTMLSMLWVVGISEGVCAVMGAYLLWRHLGREAGNRVQQDLNAARAFYDQHLETMAAALRYTAIGERFCQAVAARDTDYLAPRLEALRRSGSLDVLYVTDAQGRVICRANGPGTAGDTAASDRLVAAVLKDGKIVTGTILVPVAALRQEDPLLARRASIRILATAKARRSDQAELDAGLMICAAAPVPGPQSRPAGVLRAGILLSQDNALVDRIRDTLFRGERYAGKPLGTATVFQQDVRIATNVLREDGRRAIGTRVSAEVYDRVLRQQKEWLGRAWVVNDWYVSAYRPIRDIDAQPVGMLYVGVLERKYRDAALATLATFLLVTLAGLLAAGLVAWKLASSISHPVQVLARASQAIADGRFPETVRLRSSDEIAALAKAFNTMAQSLKERDELLKQRTRLQLTRSERLAAIGRLAAGVAHEINNPLTGVLTFSHLLLRDAPEGSQQREDLEAIIQATTRCRDITRGLLNFSRQSEPQKRPSDLNHVLREALNLTRNQAHLNRVVVREELDPHLPPLVIDPYQIQEVAVNTILNAIDAMHEGGTLTVRTRVVGEGGARGVELDITDTGAGIAPENLDRIFDPFFTTKPPGKGTGLGLATSYGIVTEHGGEIRVASEVGRGTALTVRLPVATKEPPDDGGTDTGSG